MSKIIKYDISELNAIPFGSVAERFGKVVKRGVHTFTFCPWHDDRHPSLLVGGRMNRCKCFSCGKSGSVIDYVMAKENVGFREACEMLTDPLSPPGSSPYRGSGAARGKKHGKKRKDAGSARKRIRELIERGLPTPHHRGGGREGVCKGDCLSGGWEPVLSQPAGNNPFFNCLRTIFTEEGVQFAIDEYHLGSWGDGFVMFPSIDKKGWVHNVKIQKYCDDPCSPRFFHKEEKSTFWLGSILQKQGVLPADARYDCNCLFGEHLLAKYPGMPVVLVESPKNAIVGACSLTSVIWIATGNKSNLTRERLECLRNRKVIVIPDADAVEEWRAILDGMKDIAAFVMSSFCNEVLMKQGPKGDVADYLIKKLGPL